MSNLATVILVLVLYIIGLIVIGYYAYRATTRTPEDYFLANRSLGWFVLLFAVFATNITAVTFLGVAGESYRRGVGLMGLYGFGTAFIVPAFYYIINYRAWLVGKKYGFMTQAEMLGERWASRAVSVVAFIILTFFTVPYVVTSFVGAGASLAAITKGAIPYPIGALIVATIVSFYTASGGMRGTAWTNVYQGLIFLVVSVICFVLIALALGGFSEATSKVLAENPKVLIRGGNMSPKFFFSNLWIAPLAVPIFPHVYQRVIAARSARFFKTLVKLYPILAVLTFFPVIMVAIWGTAAIPGLQGKQADSIFPMMLAKYLPPVFTGIGVAGIWAAIMSSVDAMLLTLSNMLVRDIIQPWRPTMEFSHVTRLGRIFVLAIAAVAYVVALIQPATIFSIAVFAFTGYATLAPIIIGALYWRRSNKYGALAAMLVTGALLPFYFFTPYLKWSTFGFEPVIPLLVISTAVFVVVSLVTPPAPEEATRRFFDLFDSLYRQRPLAARAAVNAPASGRTQGG